MKDKIILFTLVFFSAFTINAQTCCSGGIPLSNNLGLPNLEKGSLQFGLHYDYNNLNTLNSGSERLDDDSRLRITHSILLNSGYSITDNLSIEGLFTWVNQRRKITQFGNENLDQTSGIGDAVLLAKYNFKNIFFLGKNSNFNVGTGIKIPFGSSTEANRQGITLNADLQPGSNSWDILFWSSASKKFDFRPSFIVSTRFVYRSPGTNKSYFGDGTYKFGNEIQSYLQFSDQFVLFKTLISPNVAIKYRGANQDKTNGFKLENTGGNWVSIIPNISIDINQNLVFSTKAEIPIYSSVDGTQLTPSFRMTTGILYKIPRKKTFSL